MVNQKPLIVRAFWDEEAKVWVASSDDIPGLATEAANFADLVEKLKAVIPELLDENGRGYSDEIPFQLLSECTAIASRVAAH